MDTAYKDAAYEDTDSEKTPLKNAAREDPVSEDDDYKKAEGKIRKLKDTDRMLQAGAVSSSLVSGNEDVYAVLGSVDDSDLIILEGFKHENFRKVLVTSEEDKRKWPAAEEEYVCVISDKKVKTEKPLYRRDEAGPFSRWFWESV